MAKISRPSKLNFVAIRCISREKRLREKRFNILLGYLLGVCSAHAQKSIEFLDRPVQLPDRWTADNKGEGRGEREREREGKREQNKRTEMRQDTGWKNKVEE